MPLTTYDAQLEAWADEAVAMEQNMEALYGPPATPPTLPPLTTYDGLLEAIVDACVGVKDKLLDQSPIYHNKDSAYVKTVPAHTSQAELQKIGGKTVVWNQLVDSGTTTVPTTSGHKYYTVISGTASIVNGGSAITIVDDTADMVCDLTLMFGSGNEPTTVAEFQQQFPADYYAFNQGSLLSAGVTEVKSVGKNLADYGGGQGVPSDTNYTNATKRTFDIGKYIVGLTVNNYYNPSKVTSYSVGNNSITVTSNGTAYGISIPFVCEPSTAYSFSVTINNGDFAVGWYQKDGTWISNSTNYTTTKTLTSPANAYFGVMALRVATIDTTATFTNIQIEKSATATSYSAPFTNDYPIPASIQALEGYGWSAGTAYNYVDFERKVFVQNVGSRAYASGDESDSTVITDMTTTYYPLNPAVETDISAYLTDDNLIEVEAGGTLTFENQNGDDYRIPVPSEVLYDIDVS